MDDIVTRLRALHTQMPHRYPSPPPDGDAISFRCAACGENLDILDRSRCTVDWRAPYLEHQAADEIERLKVMCEEFASCAKSFGTKYGSDVVEFRINEKKFRKTWEKYKDGAW